MALYAVTDYVTSGDSIEAVMAALEAKIDTIDNGKTLRYVDILELPDRTYQGIIIYDAQEELCLITQ